MAFWDESTEQLQAENGVHIDPQTRRVGIWRVVLVADLPFMDQRLNGKIPKVSNASSINEPRHSGIMVYGSLIVMQDEKHVVLVAGVLMNHRPHTKVPKVNIVPQESMSL